MTVGGQASDIDAGAAVHVGACLGDDDLAAGCTELGSQGFAALAESNDQGVGGDSGGGAGCADGIGCADGHGYFLTYSSDKSALC